MVFFLTPTVIINHDDVRILTERLVWRTRTPGWYERGVVFWESETMTSWRKMASWWPGRGQLQPPTPTCIADCDTRHRAPDRTKTYHRPYRHCYHSSSTRPRSADTHHFTSTGNSTHTMTPASGQATNNTLDRPIGLWAWVVHVKLVNITKSL